MRHLLPIVLLAVARADDPAAPAPAEPAPADAVDPAPARDGDAVLDEAIAHLAAGRYEDALALSIPALSRYPALAVSFRAVSEVAADQLERRRTGATTALPDAHPGTELPTARPAAPVYTPRGPRRQTRLGFGFEAGAPTGFRLELDIDAQNPGGVDALGFRMGGNALVHDRLWPVADWTLYVDFQLSDRWQFELGTGGIVVSGFMYPAGGGAVQYDPDGPLFANLGARIAREGSWLPDAGVGFVW